MLRFPRNFFAHEVNARVHDEERLMRKVLKRGSMANSYCLKCYEYRAVQWGLGTGSSVCWTIPTLLPPYEPLKDKVLLMGGMCLKATIVGDLVQQQKLNFHIRS